MEKLDAWVNFNELDVFEFYNKFKNLKRSYIFDILNQFNVLSQQNKNNLGVTFDSLTKLGIFLSNITKINEKFKKELNNFLIRIILNSSIGYALPVFKYENNVYSKNSDNFVTINLNNELDKLNTLFNEMPNDIIVIFDILIKKEILTIYYMKINSSDDEK